MKIPTLILLATLTTIQSAFSANPFPYVTFGEYSYSSKLYNKHESLVSRERGTLRIFPLRNRGIKISIKGSGRNTTIFFYGNHHYSLTEVKAGNLQQYRKGRWRKNKGNNVIKATSQDSFSHDLSVSDFGLAQRLSIFNLRSEPGFMEKYVAHLNN